MPTITPVWRGRPTMEGNTARGASSPAKPAFTIPEPLSHTMAETSPASPSAISAAACVLLKLQEVPELLRCQGACQGGVIPRMAHEGQGQSSGEQSRAGSS